MEDNLYENCSATRVVIKRQPRRVSMVVVAIPVIICSEDQQPLGIDISTTKTSPYISIVVDGQVNEVLFVEFFKPSSDGGETQARLHKLADFEK